LFLLRTIVVVIVVIAVSFLIALLKFIHLLGYPSASV